MYKSLIYRKRQVFGQLTILSTCACFTDWSGDRHIIVAGNDCWRSSGTRCNDGGNVSGNNCFSNSGSLRSRRSMRSMSDVRLNDGCSYLLAIRSRQYKRTVHSSGTAGGNYI